VAGGPVGAVSDLSYKNCAINANRCVAAEGRFDYSHGVKTILAPIDFSPASEGVVAQAAALARAFEGKVVLLSVIQPPVVMTEYAPLLADIAEVTAAGEKNAARKLAEMERNLAEDSIPSESLQFVGAPIPHIVEQAGALGADYIVMGSHGHTALYDLLVGSTTHGVLLRAKCPVVIVPTRKPSAARKTKSEKKSAR
jgi:nucleotide-binding universal stress UspA family protein